ncbi:NodT family efflux transporter outer membrane factor (OMF) lipoprotein [Hydromonas duriensis]|uniref:NodT family efflux transporter outer membrane factor (OMF) lipoprotein n=2 Tax=Hydromonas duriensis TaxID=1527608 RepID=A0A4R6YAD5_9BURK|nr:NodT family efflux transporter outer membrane factor (OMF) lipoprotein [Hydromonas duriensis]
MEKQKTGLKPIVNSISRAGLIVTLTALGSGCAIVSGTHEPLKQVSLSELKLPEASAQARANWPKNGWWRQYQDEQLNALIEQAFAGSPNLQVLATRVESAQVAADAVKKLSYPSGGIRLAPMGQTYSENYIYPPALGGEWKYSGVVAASLSWDLDLWGRKRSQYRAALGQAAAADLEYEAARQTIAANIIGLHAQLAALDGRLKLLSSQIDLQNTNKMRWSERERAGLQPVQASVQIDSVIAQLEQLRGTFVAQREILMAQLAALVGTTPAQLPHVAMPNRWLGLSLPNELPADILGARPDIAAARHYIIAASENVDAVRKEFYPNINLSVSAGFQAIGLNNLFKAGSRFDTVEPAITLPIFSGAALNAKLRNQQAVLDSTIAQYNQTVYQAISDAGQQLASYRNTATQITQQIRLVNDNEHLAQLSQSRYAQGIAPQMESLVAQASVLSAQDTLIAQYAARRAQEAKLAVSLGTGFEGLWGESKQSVTPQQ